MRSYAAFANVRQRHIRVSDSGKPVSGGRHVGGHGVQGGTKRVQHFVHYRTLRPDTSGRIADIRPETRMPYRQCLPDIVPVQR